MRLGLFLLGAFLCMAAACMAGSGAGSPGVGDSAPDFSLAGSDGNTYNLKQFLGKKAVVIAWFPKAFTGG